MAGPFVDETDGATAEVALTLTRGDTWLSKNGATMASRVALGSGVHSYSGMYKVPLGTTDTNTLGRLRMYHKFGGTALPDWRDFNVLTQAEWDRKYGTSTINGIVASALATYDPPTHAEVTSGFTALNDVSTSQVNTQVASVLGTYDGPTHAEMTSGFTALNDPSASQINTQIASVLATYDAPTHAEVTSGFTALNDPSASQVATAVSGVLTGYISANVIQIEGLDATNQINAAVDDALNTAIPGVTTLNSINERIVSLDDYYTTLRATYLDNLSSGAAATKSQVLTQAKSALATYDGPTHTEMASGFTALNDPTASQVATAVSGALTIASSGAISSAVWGTNVLTSNVVSQDAAQYLADQWMLRKPSTVAEATINSPRTLGGGLLQLMNKTSTVGSVLYVYKADDTNVAWSATLTLDSAATQIVGVNP